MFPWWTNLLQSLGGWLVNPALFATGALLVSVPIIIHLLNRRKFKIVDWAAMDFLLEADKKNRRRVRLENFLLLLLRCLAIFLLGLLLARPFDSSGLAAQLFRAQQFERVILLDDSLSMRASVGNRSAFDIARERLEDLIRQFAGEQSDNTLTLMLTSQPERKKFHATPLSSKNVDNILLELESLNTVDHPARLPQALQELENYLSTQPANVNRVVYLLSDLRRRDWQPASEGQTTTSNTVETMRALAKHAKGCFVFDVAEEEDRNLVIEDVIPEKSLVAGVESRFEVRIANSGSRDATNLKVRFTVGQAVPMTQDVELLAAGERKSLQFSTQFTSESADERSEQAVPERIKVELQSEKAGEDDRLAEDSVFYVPAQVIPGIPTLLVDGDPSASFGKAETFYLKRALRPAGHISSGIAPEIATENELETLDLAKYQVIFLCNVYRLQEKSLHDLRNWVAAGGGLVIMPGEHVDESHFNQTLFGSGESLGNALAPARLESIQGDDTERTWVGFKIDDVNHPVLAEFAGQQNPLLNNLKIFRWWKMVVASPAENAQTSPAPLPPDAPKLPAAMPSQVLARFTDADDSPAIVERPLGKGRVFLMALPADAEWSNWTSDPSYILTMQLLTRYLAQGDARSALLRVDEALRKEIDLTKTMLDAELIQPGDRRIHLQAVQLAAGENSKPEPNRWLLEQPHLERQGFYELQLVSRAGGMEPVLFAANVDPTEGELHRAYVTQLERELREAGVKFVSGGGSGVAGLGAQLEIWKYLLWALIALLLAEQVLGWFFGLRR